MLISSLYFLNPDVKSIFDRTMAWFDTFFFVLSRRTILFEAKQLCFILLLVWFILPMIDFWSYRLPESWRRWSAIQYVLRAWVGNPSLSSNFFKNTWTEFGRHKNWCLPNFNNKSPKNLSDHKNLDKNRLANLWSLSKLTSQATKRWKKTNV